MTAASTGVLVLGMHRSGTSAFTKVLNLMGAELGARLKAAGPDNPRGFWEHEAIIDAHEALMDALGRAWDDVRPLPDRWRETAAAREAAAAIAAVIRQDLACHPLWAVKDPRLCRFVPLWCDVLQDLGIAPRAVIVHREPVEVARSLHARNGLPEAVGQLLWARYMVDAEASSRAMVRSLVSYGDLLADWRGVMDRVGRELGIGLACDSAVEAQVETFLTRSLRHHVGEGGTDLPAGVADLADAYRGAARGAFALDEVAGTAAKVDTALGSVLPVIEGLSQQVMTERGRAADRTREVQEMAVALAEATRWGTSRDEELRRIRDTVQRLEDDLRKATEWGASRDRELRTAVEQIESLRSQLAESTEWGASRDQEVRATIDQIEFLRSQLAESTEWGSSRDQALQEAGHRLLTLQNELAQSTQWGASRDRELQAAVARIHELETERAALEEEMNRLSDRLAAEMETLANRADHADAALARKQQEVDGLQRQTNDLNARIAALERRVHHEGLRNAAVRFARRFAAAAKLRTKLLLLNVVHAWPGSVEARHARVARVRTFNQARRTGLNGHAVLADLHTLARDRWPAQPAYRMRTGEAVEPLDLDISVVVYESERWVAAFMASLAAVDYPLERIRLHVRDHSRSDASQRAFQAFFDQTGCVLGGYHYSRGANLGFGAGHNHNFRQSSAGHFLVTNIDGRFQADTLTNLMRAVATSDTAVAAWELRQVPYEHPKYYDPVTMLTTWVSGACVLFRRTAYAAVGGFDDAIFMYGEDVDLSYRLRAAGHSLAYVPHAVFQHDAYVEPEQFKPLQFHGSTLANALLRLRFGSWADIAAIPSMWRELRASARQLGQLAGYRANLRKLLRLAPRFLLTRPGRRAVKVPFTRWDYGLRKDGAFEHIENSGGDEPLVSIVVRTYRGREALLRQALASIANQTYRNVEAIVVEDRGDTLREVAATTAAELGLQVHYQACLEPASNRCLTGNRGLQTAKGVYLNFLDDDDLLFADHVEYLVSRLRSNPEAAACYALAWEAKVAPDPSEPGVFWEVMHSSLPGHKREFDRAVLAEFNYMPIQAVMFRRHVYERFGGMDLRLENLEDWELWRRYSLERDFRYCPKTTSIYHIPADVGIQMQRQALLDEYLPVARRIAAEAQARFVPLENR